MRIARFFGCLVLLAGALVSSFDSAGAQGSDAGSDAARRACTPDAMRLCSDFIPDVAKVTTCMKEKLAQLSEPCRIVMKGSGRAAGAKAAGANEAGAKQAGRKHVEREARHHRHRAARGVQCDPFSHLCN
jgi:hypothetical protein